MYKNITREIKDGVLFIGLNRPKKRNALSDELVREIGNALADISREVGCIVLHGQGKHFSAGLDLSELQERDAVQGLFHSLSWRPILDKIQFGPVPVIAALHGACIGGGLELASSAHIRVADRSTFYAFPEGTRGIFVGGGGSVRVPKLVGAATMVDMMLTGRVHRAEEGHRLGFAQYLVEEGEALEKARELALRICENAPMTNFAIMQVLPRIADSSQDIGLLMESLAAAVTQSAPEAKERLQAFLEGRAGKVGELNLKSTPFLKIPILQPEIVREEGENGVIYFRSKVSLEPHPRRITDRLVQWAKEKPESVFLGQRNEHDEWRRLKYGEALDKAQKIGQYLLNRKLSKETPVVMLSGNSLEMGLLKLACMHVGIPFSPISPAYSTRSSNFTKLRHCIDLLTPGLIFVQDGTAYQKPLSAVAPDIPVLAVKSPLPHHDSFATALNTTTTPAVANAYENIREDTVAKILFTSGSTGLPKGVMNTHGNLTTNAQQTVQTLPFMMDDGFHLIDWLPWNHTFGGNNNFGMALYTGGSLHIDDGMPTPQDIRKTLRNLRDIAPTIYYNVPKGFEELLPYLKKDRELCRYFFSRLKMFFYAGAGMPQHMWDDLEQLAYDTTGKRLFIGTGLGMTEASPSCMFNTQFGSAPGKLGVPEPGLEVKLVPDEDKLEARFRGKNLTPGYWRDPEATARAFDEEGFYKTGDALKEIDPADPAKGMIFDGRIAENFKLQSGTWVSVGYLRMQLIAAGDGLVKDAVITGHDRAYLGAIVIPELNFCRSLAGLPDTASIPEIVGHPAVRQALQRVIDDLGAKSTGSSNCIRRVIFADFELSIDEGEITDKGSINQRAILRNRVNFTEKLYRVEIPAEVLVY